MSAKQGNQGSESAALRPRLKHPVIDSDGHWVEFGPDLMDYLKEVGGTRAAEGFRNRPYEGWHLTVPLKERRERRLRHAMNNSFGFGGTNCALLLSRFDG